jgi:hexosaminidase
VDVTERSITKNIVLLEEKSALLGGGCYVGELTGTLNIDSKKYIRTAAITEDYGQMILITDLNSMHRRLKVISLDEEE